MNLLHTLAAHRSGAVAATTVIALAGTLFVAWMVGRSIWSFWHG